MKPLGAPFFFAVCKLLIAIICLVTWIVHNEKSEPLKIRYINKYIISSKIHPVFGYVFFGYMFFFLHW